MERKDWNYKTYLGDCIDGMRLLPAGSVDFLFTDLPYGRTNCKWDTPIDLDAFWSEADRVVKKDGAVALFAQTPFDKVLGCSNLSNLRYEWIWEKSNATGHLNAKRMPMRAHENILIFYRRQPTYNPQKTDGHQPVNSYTHYIDTQNRTEIYQKATKEVKGGGNTDRYPRSVVKGPAISRRATCTRRRSRYGCARDWCSHIPTPARSCSTAALEVPPSVLPAAERGGGT